MVKAGDCLTPPHLKGTASARTGWQGPRSAVHWKCPFPPPEPAPASPRSRREPSRHPATVPAPARRLAALCDSPGEALVVTVAADPASVRLSGPDSPYSLLVTGKTADGRARRPDARRDYSLARPKVAASARRRGAAVGDGATTVSVEAARPHAAVPVAGGGDAASRGAFHFENDIMPLLSRFGCNSSGCHGKAEGQNGFKLSVFGFDPAADYDALVKEARGRRVLPAAPEQSLLLAQGVGRDAARRRRRASAPASAEYETLRGWIAAGMPVRRRRRADACVAFASSRSERHARA